MQWRRTVSLGLLIALQVINSSCQQSSESNSDYAAQLLQKLEEIEKTNAENAAVFRKQLSEQSLAIQKFQDLKESLQQLSQQNTKLSDTLQKLQEKQLKAENGPSKNKYAVRLLLQSAGLKLGDMLISAVKEDDIPRVQQLLELGAPVEFQDSKTNRPIHIAVQNRHARILQILLDYGADIESKGEHQKTALHVAGYTDCLECAKILLRKSAKLESRDEWLNTPIVHPARIGFNDFLELLIQKGANVNAGRMDGLTALHWAARDGQLATAMLLVKSGADVRLKSQEGKTALDYAIASHHSLIAEFLKNF